jgi:hypothetical protein
MISSVKGTLSLGIDEGSLPRCHAIAVMGVTSDTNVCRLVATC